MAWLDVMGMGAVASRSVMEAAIKTFKLHIASLAAYEASSGPHKQQLNMYPMMDGIYLISSDKAALIELLNSVFIALGKNVVDTDEFKFILIIKGTIAYGPIIEGEQLDGSNELLKDTQHKARTMVGLPIIQAFKSEEIAPPFGVHVHESARAFAPEGEVPLNSVWWEWFRPWGDDTNQEDLARDVHEKLDHYYDWCQRNSERIGYDTDSITEHRGLVDQYLPDIDG